MRRRLPPISTSAAQRQIELWRVPLDQPPRTRRWAWQMLNHGEQLRARRLRFSGDRWRWIVARAALREVLGRRLNCVPQRVCFGVTGAGKPVLRGPRQRPEFNLSHAGDFALVALSSRFPVGVDIEAARALPDLESLAGMVFSPRELLHWRTQPAARKLDAFYRTWTRKEAIVKATGAGLGVPLPSINVTAAAAQKLAVAEYPARADSADWTLRDIRVAPGYVAALAVLGHAGSSIRVRHWLAPASA